MEVFTPNKIKKTICQNLVSRITTINAIKRQSYYTHNILDLSSQI